jgi:hypothetical protein
VQALGQNLGGRPGRALLRLSQGRAQRMNGRVIIISLAGRAKAGLTVSRQHRPTGQAPFFAGLENKNVEEV